MEFLFAKPRAADAVFAVFQEISVIAVNGVRAILQKVSVPAFLAIHAVIAERTCFDVVAIDAVGIFIKIAAVHAILISDAIGNEVAIFAVVAIVAIIAVDGIDDYRSHTRGFEFEPFEFFEKIHFD